MASHTHQAAQRWATSELAARTRAVLTQNRVVVGGGRHHYTRPALSTYPHQWLWDSCFHARIYTLLGDPAAAHAELRALFRAQVATGPDRGRLPHMTLLGAEPGEAAQDEAGAAQYARDVELWGDPRASSITQPPLVAETVLDVGDLTLWRELFAPLCAYYDWWLRRRDPRGEHLVVCHHVWETGADATPRADAAAARLLATGRTPRALDKGTVNVTAKKRADLLAARFLMLEDLQAIDADELAARISSADADRRRLALYGHVAIEMQGFLVSNLIALATIGDRLGEAAAATRYRAEASAISAAVNAQLWDEARGTYLDRWDEPATPITVRTYAPFLALAAADLVPRARAERLLANLVDPSAFWTRWPVPTVPRDDVTFDADEYWRGSTWLNINWFVVRGLVASAARFDDPRYLPPARAIAERTVALVEQVGFREYYRSEPAAGAAPEPAGFGPSSMSWSGIVLDLARALEQELADVSPTP